MGQEVASIKKKAPKGCEGLRLPPPEDWITRTIPSADRVVKCFLRHFAPVPGTESRRPF
jgi:hypothetical protein